VRGWRGAEGKESRDERQIEIGEDGMDEGWTRDVGGMREI
jgi:hypothetical protein